MVREILIFFTSQIGMRCEVDICIAFLLMIKAVFFRKEMLTLFDFKFMFPFSVTIWTEHRS